MRFGTAVPVAAGATGRVVRAFDHERGEDVALKLLHRDDPAWVQRMLREAEVQMRLDHPSICRVYATGRLGEQPYIAMRFIDGQPLDRACAGLSDRDKAALVAQVADAIAHAHRHGVVHRDLKPSNILVEQRDDGPHPVVVDFGLVHDVDAPELTRTGQLLGTPGYMAPEQAMAAARVDGRADIYSLGVVLFELYAGRRPFSGESAAEILMRTLRDEPPSLDSLRPDIDPALARIVRQCLETDADWRYPTADALRDDLLAFAAGRRVSARSDGRLRRAHRFARRHPWRAGLGTAAAVLALGVAGIGTFSVLYAREQSAAAQAYMEFAAGITQAIRFEYMKPAHDIAPVRERLRGRVEQVAASLPDSGPAARRTGQLALGRALLALGEHARARGHLLAAQAAGEDGPELHAALGELLMRDYVDALQATAAIDEAPLREAAVQQLGAAHGQVAREHLRRAAQGEGARARQMGALLDHFDGHSARAEQTLTEVADELAYPVDALLFAGDLAAIDALRNAIAGDAERALLRWREALARYRAASGVARSHSNAVAAECRAGGALVGLRRYGAALEDAEWQAALARCDDAIALDPANPNAHASKAQAFADLGLLQRHRGQWSDADFEPALVAARQALALQPGASPARRALGTLLTQRALRQAEASEPGAAQTAAEAIALLEEAQAEEPTSAHGAIMLSNAYLAAARAAVIDEGGDGERFLQAAELALERAGGGGEVPLVLELHIINTKAWRGFEAYMAGRDPGTVLVDAVARAQRLAARAPDHPQVQPALGHAAWTLLEHQRMTGADADAAGRLAVAAYRHVVEREDASFSDLFNAVGALQSHARQKVERGQTIGAELALLEDWTARLATRAGSNPIEIQYCGNALLRGLEALRAGLDPSAAFAAARDTLRPLLGRSIDAREAHMLLAEVVAAEHAWRRTQRRTDADLAAEDETHVLAGVEQFPDYVALRATAARALLALPPTPDRAMQARRLFDEAVAAMPALATAFAATAAELDTYGRTGLPPPPVPTP